MKIIATTIAERLSALSVKESADQVATAIASDQATYEDQLKANDDQAFEVARLLCAWHLHTKADEALRQLLRSPQTRAAAGALWQLSLRVPRDRSICRFAPELLSCLHHGDADVRRKATDVLRAAPQAFADHPEVRRLLEAGLSDACHDVRWGCSEARVLLGDCSARQLIDYAQHSDDAVARGALAGCQKLALAGTLDPVACSEFERLLFDDGVTPSGDRRQALVDTVSLARLAAGSWSLWQRLASRAPDWLFAERALKMLKYHHDKFAIDLEAALAAIAQLCLAMGYVSSDAVDVVERLVAGRPGRAKTADAWLDQHPSDFARAVRPACREQLTDPPQSFAQWLQAAENHRRDGQLGEAKRAYRAALSIRPDDLAALNNLTLLIGDDTDEDNSEAARLLRHAVKVHPDSAMSWSNLGNRLQALGEVDKSLDAYRRATELDPDRPMFWSNLAAGLKRSGDIAGALEAAKRAVAAVDRAASDQAKRDAHQAHYNLACYLALSEMHAEALDQLSRAIGCDDSVRQMARTDADFAALREDSRFRALVGQPAALRIQCQPRRVS